MKKQGKLKPAPNEADTGGVVGSVKGCVYFGRMKTDKNKNMVAANASRKRR